MSEHKLSIYQENIGAFVDDASAGNAIVIAVAGSGKSTTLVMAQKRAAAAGLSTISLAFNKSTEVTLTGKGVYARTWSSLCYSGAMRSRKARTVTKEKTRILLDECLSGNDARAYGPMVARLVDLGKQCGIGCLIPDTQAAWLELIERHDLELDTAGASYERACEIASNCLADSCNSPLVDFNDMLYLTVRDGLTLPTFDFVFIDEAQDTNSIQRALLRKILKPSSRILAVGDPAQAIYGFRGADSESMNLIASEFNCKSLPLTVSYRCPVAVIEHARQWVSHIEPAPNAPNGSVTSLKDHTPEHFKPADLVVCRTTKPLIALAYQLLRAQKPVRIMGREIGDGLISLIKKMNAKGIDALQGKLAEFTAREVQKAIAKKQESRAEAIQDKSDCIFCLIDGLPETERTVPALINLISSLFDNVANATILATVHKAKGMEASRVFWLNSSKCPASWAKQEWQQQQEKNLCYVATTRAMSELILIEEKRNGAQK